MNFDSTIQRKVCDYVGTHQNRLVEIIRDLVHIPSENKPPLGAERECQEYADRFLRDQGLEPELYELTKVPGLLEHPLCWPGRNYEDRPNLGARRKGISRSSELSGQPWRGRTG